MSHESQDAVWAYVETTRIKKEQTQTHHSLFRPAITTLLVLFPYCTGISMQNYLCIRLSMPD